MLAGMQAAQMWRIEELMPKDLLPIIRSNGTIKPIIGPATYQGQGSYRNCFIKHYLKERNDFNLKTAE
jgi:hypothetical protein